MLFENLIKQKKLSLRLRSHINKTPMFRIKTLNLAILIHREYETCL